MKNFAIILMCALLCSCASTRKATHDTNMSDKSEQTAEKVEQIAERVVDTTRTERGKITITEIEFFPSDLPVVSDTSQPAPYVGEVNVSNVIVKGSSVKSIKQTTIEQERKQNGERRESEECKIDKRTNVAEKIEQTADVVVEPAPDPYRWRYIFYIALIGIAVLLYFERQPVLNAIRKILSQIRRVL